MQRDEIFAGLADRRAPVDRSPIGEFERVAVTIGAARRLARWVAVLCLVPLAAAAQQASGAGADTAERRAAGGFVALVVPDLEASVRWYGQALGLRELSRSRGAAEIVVVGGEGLVVELIHFSAPAPADSGSASPTR